MSTMPFQPQPARTGWTAKACDAMIHMPAVRLSGVAVLGPVLVLAQVLVVVLGLILGLAAAHAREDVPFRHAIAMHGSPALPEDFDRLPFTDRYATIGGKITLGEIGTFDNLNPFIVGGTQPWIHLDRTHFVIQRHTVESLMARSVDEPFTLYGLIAEKVRLPEDRSWMEFALNPDARFSDGSPITPEDVIFSLQTLAAEGRPNMRRYYQAVAATKVTGPHSLRVTFGDDANRETPLIIALMPVLSKTYYSDRDFARTTLDPPLGSGPYVVRSVDPGKSLTFERNPDYWAADLPINRDRNNFEIIQYQYFRDPSILFEAFKTGEVHVRIERDAGLWRTGYAFPAARNRLILKEEIPHGRPADMYGLVFNTRRSLFADKRVREALVHLFNFEWMNKNFYYGSYTRIQSYFDNSEMSSHGRPATPPETAILQAVEADLPKSLLAHGWRAPVHESQSDIRLHRRTALALLQQAGWQLTQGRLVHGETGDPFTFEMMLYEREEEKLAQSFAKDLQAVGIDMRIRLLDSANFHQRRQTYDFDMAPFRWRGTLSPGNEQAFRYGSKEAEIDGTFNLAGVRSSAVDETIEILTNARTRPDLVAAARALDRLLLSGYYAIPLFFAPADRVAYWVEFQRPRHIPLTGLQLDAWWKTSDN